jgi:hypothetical protein
VLHQAAVAAGCPRGGLAARHVASLDALVTGWRGQRGADLPGGIRAQRRCGKLLLHAHSRAGGAGHADQARQAERAEGAGGRG